MTLSPKPNIEFPMTGKTSKSKWALCPVFILYNLQSSRISQGALPRSIFQAAVQWIEPDLCHHLVRGALNPHPPLRNPEDDQERREHLCRMLAEENPVTE